MRLKDPFARAPLGWLKGLRALTGGVLEDDSALSTCAGHLTGRFIKTLHALPAVVIGSGSSCSHGKMRQGAIVEE